MTEPKWWDCTLSRMPTHKDGSMNPWSEITTDMLGQWLMSHGAERVVIGEEVGEGGYEHWQMRMVFHKPTSFERVTSIIAEGHWTATIVRNFDYCEKEGNFWRSWEGALRKFQSVELWKWQSETLELLKQTDDRRIHVLVDKVGNSGKTTLAKVITAKHLGSYCPAMDESKDYMAWALAHSTSRIFVLDIPKADSRKKNADLWSAVEQMKNGYLWDKRNHWQEKWIDPPSILVITNEEPDREMLSWDRWHVGHFRTDVGIHGTAPFRPNGEVLTVEWE